MEVLIVGGGCIGLSLASELASDHDVRVLDKGRVGRGSSWAAAGMIAPVMEAEYGEDELLELSLWSQELYPDFIRKLEEETNRTVDYRTNGTLGLAFDQPQAVELERKAQFLRDEGFEVESLDTEEVRSLEPRISSYIVEGLYVPSERRQL